MMEVRKEFRGISQRLAVQYLENLGGTSVDDGNRVDGDGWSATLSEQKVNPVGSIRLNEVKIDFEGEEKELEALLKAFERKAIRAGG